MAKITIKRGTRVVISLKKGKPFNRSKKSPDQPLRQSLGAEPGGNALFPRLSRSIYRPRRPVASGLEFRDLGRIKQGNSFIDSSFAHPATYIVAAPVAPYNYVEYAWNKITTSGWSSFKTSLLATPEGGELKDQRERLGLETSDFLYLDVELYNSGDTSKMHLAAARRGSRFFNTLYPRRLIDNDNWTDRGLKLTQKKRHLKTVSYGYYENFDTGDPVHYKITESDDFAAPEVTFDVSKTKSLVYLVPRLFLEMPGQFNGNYPFNNGALYYYANAVFTQMPRFFTTLTSAGGGLPAGTPVLTYPDANPDTVGFRPYWDAGVKRKIEDLIYSRATNRIIANLLTLSQNGGGFNQSITTPPLSTWETLYNYGDNPTSYLSISQRVYNMFQVNNYSILPFVPSSYGSVNFLTRPDPGTLVGLIEQGNKKYYIWAKTVRSNYEYSTLISRWTSTGFPPPQNNQWNLRSS